MFRLGAYGPEAWGQGPGGAGGRGGPAGQGARGQDMTFGLLHGSKTNARENFLFNGLFKTPKFDLQEKLTAKKNFRPGSQQYRYLLRYLPEKSPTRITAVPVTKNFPTRNGNEIFPTRSSTGTCQKNSRRDVQSRLKLGFRIPNSTGTC